MTEIVRASDRADVGDLDEMTSVEQQCALGPAQCLLVPT